MATIIVNGCFDVFHAGHEKFLRAAKNLGHRHIECKWTLGPTESNRLVVAVNSDASARKLKLAKWGEKYPIDNQLVRMQNVAKYADEVVGFDSESELHTLIEWLAPCVLCKGPDYAGKIVTGADLAPVVILDTPEPESVKEMKRRVYSHLPETESRG